MIFGDPFSLALQFDIVESWNDCNEYWKNGLFSFYIDGHNVFDTVDVVELRTTISFYAQINYDAIMFNNSNLDAEIIYHQAQNYFLGESEELPIGLYDLTCTVMGDNDCYVYFIKTNFYDRLIWSINNGKFIQEKLLPKNTLKDLVLQLPKKL